MFSGFRTKHRGDQGPHHRIHLEAAGEEHIERISRAARSMPWPVLLLELAWTAGPATFIAAAGGYYLGFGKGLPAENAVFFLGYTVIFGLIGIATSLVHRTVWQPRKQRAQRQLGRALDLLPDLFMAVRELRLEAMDPDTRRLESAGYLLHRVDLAPQAIALLVEELTGDTRLAALAAKIELYRRAGLHGRVGELVEQAREAAVRATARLSSDAPGTAALLNDRLFGRTPGYEEGLPRTENFLERILAATEADDDRLMTLEDVEQLLMLGFEMLSGRELVVLSFEYRGRWETARALDRLHLRWNRYRIATAVGYSRLKALEELLAGSHAIPTTLGPRGQAPDALSHNTLAGIRALNDAAEAILELPATERQHRRARLDTLVHTLSQALRLHAAAQRACAQMGRRHALFLRNLQTWEAATAKNPEDATTLRTDAGRVGLRLVERHIALDDEEKLSLAARVDAILQEHGLRTRDGRVVYGPAGRERRLTPELAKTLAAELLLKLDELIGLSRPDVQRAVYASPVANLHGLESGQSAATKAGLGAAAAHEVQQAMGLMAERLATVLVDQYQVSLSAEAIDFLCRSYGARKERLATLADQSGASRRIPFSPLSRAPSCNLAGDPGWAREVARARRILRAGG